VVSDAEGKARDIRIRGAPGGAVCFQQKECRGTTVIADPARKSEAEIDLVFSYLRTQFPVITVHKGKTLSYLGMLFDFREDGAVYVTMQGALDDLLEGCRVDKCSATPAGDNLFAIRDAPKVSEKEAVWCRSYVAKILYVAKRVKPECLTAVSFLTSRVGAYDIDDLGKVRRLLGYIRKTRTAGV
jgi:hypothetical protein